MNDDSELLRRYVEDHSEAAFTELVHRHLGFVYATALRRVGQDSHLAEDVAQKVFTDLAGKAASLRKHPTITGWLYVSTHVGAAAVVRSEQRRKVRETEAQSMQTLLEDSSPTSDWQHLRPTLEAVIVALRADEREALALRFFEQRSFAEIGAALRLTEEAARKRVARALEKLRSVLARRGITSTTAVLAVAVGEFATQSVPPGLAAKIAGNALAGSAASGAGTTIAALGGSGLLVASSALLLGAFAVGHQYRINRNLAVELANLDAHHSDLVALRAENRQLSRTVDEAEGLRRLAARSVATPAPREPTTPGAGPRTPDPLPVSAAITIQPGGTLRWGTSRVTLEGFISRLKALQENSPDGEPKIKIQALGKFSDFAYVIDEASKAGISHLVVESIAPPDPQLDFPWF